MRVVQAPFGPPGVQPFDRIVEAFRRAADPQAVAHQALYAGRVIHAPHLAHRQHHARGAGDARRLIHLERGRHVEAAGLHRLAERDRVFQRHAGALREVLHHRMRRVTQQRGRAVAPARDRVAVGRAPSAPRGRPVEQLARARMHALEVRQHFVLAAVAHAPLLLLAAVEGDDQVVLLAVAQRVVHQVAVRAGPDHRCVPAQVGRHVGRRHHRAVHHMARHARRIAQQRGAHHRLHAVAADDGIGLEAATVARDGNHALRTRVDGLDQRRGVKADQRMLLHRVVDRTMQVGPMAHRIRIAKARAKRVADRHRRDFAAVDRVHHHQPIGEHRTPPHRLAHAQRVECGEGVGAELQPGTDLADGGALLQQIDRHADARERQRGRHAADAAADEQDGGRVLRGGCGHVDLLQAIIRCGRSATAGRRYAP